MRNPELGAWPETAKRRAVWWTMAAALPCAFIAFLAALGSCSASSEANRNVEELLNRPQGDWDPFYTPYADMKINEIADFMGWEVVTGVSTAEQAQSVGVREEGIVAHPSYSNFNNLSPEALAYLASITGFSGHQEWVSPFNDGVERYVYVLSHGEGGDQRYEMISFVVRTSEAGYVGMSWPMVYPFEEAESAPASTDQGEDGESGAGQEPEQASEQPDAPGASFDGYEDARNKLGIAEDAHLVTSCGTLQSGGGDLTGTSPGLTQRLEEFLDAYTSRDSDSLEQIAGAGGDWPLYPRAGYRHRTGSMRVLCETPPGQDDAEGLAQVWWIAEAVTDPEGRALPEIRDLRIVDAQGVWYVRGAGPLWSGGAPDPVVESER